MYKDLPSWYYHVYCFFYNNISAVHPTLLQVYRCYWILYKQELQHYIDGESRNNQHSRRLLSNDFSVCLGLPNLRIQTKPPNDFYMISPKSWTRQRARSRGVTRAVLFALIGLVSINRKSFISEKSFSGWVSQTLLFGWREISLCSQAKFYPV